MADTIGMGFACNAVVACMVNCYILVNREAGYYTVNLLLLNKENLDYRFMLMSLIGLGAYKEYCRFN